jgi:glucoamylase
MEAAEDLLETLESFSSETGLIPEQVWDADDIPELELYPGKSTGSAMPLVWAHAEHIKLIRSIFDGEIFDMPLVTQKRYIADKQTSPYVYWSNNNKPTTIISGKILRIQLLNPALIHWTSDGWETENDSGMKETNFGVYYCDLSTEQLPMNTEIIFTIFWKEVNKWEGKDHRVKIV